ncbi:MAG TPA: glycosyltransferase family 2 protein, partial [Bacillota bacterium]|nr:glycosyltransferase family 2 protein [Bacillota bacterium]
MNLESKNNVLKDGISLFFPAYNEEANVGGTIEKSVAILETLGCPYEVIIVDDGSRDRTADIVREYAAKNPNVILELHEKNRGYGGALQTGFHRCTKGLIFFSDCDLQFDLSEIKLLIEKMQNEPTMDAVIGYRIKRADPFIRKLNAFGWKMWARILFGIKVKDIDCAFKLFKRGLIENIRIESTGALINVEILAKIKHMGSKIAELGVHHYPRTAGTQTGAKIKVILRAFYESFTLYSK